MMDMEMNAELERDGESETGEPSTEGSSAGSIFCTLEQDYARIKSEMKTNEILAMYEAEYTRLFESLYKAQRKEEELMGNYELLKEKFENDTMRITELEKTIELNNETIVILKQDIEYAKKLENAAHSREYKAQDIINHYEMTIAKLNNELEQKNKQFDGEDNTATNKQKDLFFKEKDKLLGEIEVLRENNKKLLSYNKELENKNKVIDQEKNDIQEFLDTQINELTKEHRLREKAENEIKQQQDEIICLNNDLQSVKSSINVTTSKISNLENILKENKATIDNNQKIINKLMQEKMNLLKDFDNLNSEKEKTNNILIDKMKDIETLKEIINRIQEESAKLKIDKSLDLKKFAKEISVCNKIKKDLQQVQTHERNCKIEMVNLNKYLEIMEKEKDSLTREKESLTKKVIYMRTDIKNLTAELKVYEQTQQKIESDVIEMSKNVNNVNKQLSSVEKERDKVVREKQELAQQIENKLAEINLLRNEIADQRKLLIEADIKYKHLQNSFDIVKSERNSCRKNFNEAEKEIESFKNKLKITSHQVEQLKEELSIKDKNLNQEEFQLGKMEKDKDDLKLKLQDAQKYTQTLRHEIEEMRKEEKQLRSTILKMNMDIGKQKKEINSMISERDILNANVVKKSNEINIQNEKIKQLTITIQCGEIEYSQRVNEIRLLKLEVKKLRVEKTLLSKSIDNTCDLRHEVFHLNRMLTKERLKVKALEEEMQNPLNIHRWRKLEKTDPDILESQQKIQALNRRILQLGTILENKEKALKDIDQRNRKFEEIIIKQCNPDLIKRLNEAQNTIKAKEEKIKSLLGELNMHQYSKEEHKLDLERLNIELRKLKEKYYGLKRKERKFENSKTENHDVQLAPVIQDKVCATGFNTTISNVKK